MAATGFPHCERSEAISKSPYIALTVLCASGCDVQTLYEVEVPAVGMEYGRASIERDDFSLEIVAHTSDDAPGVSLIARVDDLKPTWDWEDFDDWPVEERTTVFNAWYENKFPAIDVSFSGGCPAEVEGFDQRESAREVLYGQWLHNVTTHNDPIRDFPRGLSISIPVYECGASLEVVKSKPLSVSITVAGQRDTDPGPIDIELHVRKVGTWLVVWGRQFEID